MKNNNFADFRIFIPFLVITVIVSAIFAVFESESLSLLNIIFEYIVDIFSWGYLWYAMILLIAALYFSFSRYGDIVMGSPTDRPQFSMFEYAAILISTGLGASVMRTSILQWTDVALDPPYGIEAQTDDALLMGSTYGMFVWTPLIFAIFVIAAPALGYMLHVRKKPFLRISEACRPLLGDRITDGIIGKILDIIFLLSILSGASVTLGFATPIVTYNLSALFNIEMNFIVTVIVIAVWFLIFTMSAYLGIEKGIKKLSTFNMYLAGALALFIIVIGPGIFILNFFSDSLSSLAKHYLDMSLFTDAISMEEGTFIDRNTIFWIAYNATWGMLGSVFIAKVSKGRTVKEMILTYLIGPTLVSWVMTGIFGGLGVHRQVTGEVDVLGIVQKDPFLAVPEILSSLPLGPLVIVSFIIVSSVFLITTLDSTTYTIASYTSGKNMSNSEPSKNLRLIIGVLLAGLALLLLRIGGLPPLEVLSGIMGIPIILIQFALIYAAIKMMNEDEAWIHNVRSPEQKKKYGKKAKNKTD